MHAQNILRLISTSSQKRVSRKLLDIRFIPTGDQLDDGFTKPLTIRWLDEFKYNLKLGSIT